MAETKYSESDLKEFHELIISKLALAQEDLDQLRASMSYKDDHTTADNSPTIKLMENDSEKTTR